MKNCKKREYHDMCHPLIAINDLAAAQERSKESLALNCDEYKEKKDA